jgi:hypothetical protein
LNVRLHLGLLTAESLRKAAHEMPVYAPPMGWVRGPDVFSYILESFRYTFAICKIPLLEVRMGKKVIR